MKITAIRTHKILPNQESLEPLLDRYIKKFSEKSILVVTSKIVSFCEGRVVPAVGDKEKLLQAEADYYLPKRQRRFHYSCTITHHSFSAAAGIDESNAAGHYVLLPVNPQKSADQIYRYLKRRFNRRDFGVIITDSHSTPLRRGALGIALAYRGFVGLKDYRGVPDLFGRKMRVEQANLVDALAGAAVAVMGEGAEQAPLVCIEETSGIKFRKSAPTPGELKELFVDIENDIFSPLFNFRRLKKGGRKH